MTHDNPLQQQKISELEPLLKGPSHTAIDSHPYNKQPLTIDTVITNIINEMIVTEKNLLKDRIKSKDGTYLWTHSRGDVYRDDNGKPTLVSGILTPIEETQERSSRI